jgi:DNA-binding MarR family transcriptional regulator
MNGTKIDILRCLSDGDWWTTPEVAHECDLSLTNTSELLRRYRSQSLVNRERNFDVPRGYFYRITDVGLERLEYLCSNEIKTSQVLAEEAGLRGVKKRAFDSWVKQKLAR